MNDVESCLNRTGAGLQQLPQRFICSCYRGSYLHQVTGMQLLKQVQVAQYKCIFSKYTYRIAVFEAYLQYLPGQFHLAFCGLITICIGR
ncbi:hypothetical protein D3C80_1656450 [compost metagenome]